MGQYVKNGQRIAQLEAQDFQQDIQQIQADLAVTETQQTRFEAKQERYRVGRTNAYQVVLSQRELLEAQVREAESLITYLKELTQFYRFEGTLLQRHGVQFKEGVMQ